MSNSNAPAGDLPARSAVRATYAAFIFAGLALASWAARIPQVRDELALEPSQLGLVLLSLAIGSITSLLLAGHLVHRLGSRRTVSVMAIVLAAALLVIAVGYPYGVPPVVVGLFAFGFALGAWDVAMNVQGAHVERRIGRSIMSRFHAGFSLGTVAGALLGAALVALDIGVTVHLAGIAVIVGGTVVAMVRGFLSDPAEDPTPGADQGGLRRALRYWAEPRTLVIGVFVLAFAFTEGIAIDWIGVAVIDGYQAPAAAGTLAFAMFLAAMTATRWIGPALLDRFGRVPVLRVLAAVGMVGLLLFVYGNALPAVFAGALLWGVGTALGFPVGMSAASDDPAGAASRVSVVATIGYLAFLAGPPLIGFLGDQVSVLRALVTGVGLLALAFLITGATRSRATAPTTRT